MAFALASALLSGGVSIRNINLIASPYAEAEGLPLIPESASSASSPSIFMGRSYALLVRQLRHNGLVVRAYLTA